MISSVVRVRCKQYADSDKCPVRRAQKLHRKYLAALQKQNDFYNSKEGCAAASVTMQSAEFVMRICKDVISSDKFTEKDIVKKLRSNSPEPVSLKDTSLYNDIENLKNHKIELEKNVEKAAEDLIKVLSSSEFQNDLLKNHHELENTCSFLTSAEIKQYYPDIPADKRSKTKIRTLDHICADLTDHLVASDNGVEFLGDLLDENKLKNLPAFDSVWGLLTKGKAAIEKNVENAQDIKLGLEAFGRFIQNVIPYMDYKIKLLLHKNALSSVDSVFRNSAVEKVLSFLDNRFNVQISKWVKERTASLIETINTSMEQIKIKGSSWDNLNSALSRRAYNDADDLANDVNFKEAAGVHEHLKRLDSAHIALALDSISLFISCVKIAADVKNMNAKDVLSGINDLMGVVKTSLETYESVLTLQSARYSGRKGDLFLKSARNARVTAKVLGIAAAIISTIISIIDLCEGIKRRDRQQIGVASAGVVFGAGAIVAAALSMAVLSGVLLAAGLILAIVSMLILDPPILNYLEDIYWGKDFHLKSSDRRIMIGDTINKFFSIMFKLEVRYSEPYEDKDYNQIEIRSGMISDNMPIFVEVVEANGDSKTKIRFFPQERSFSGKGKVYKTTNLYIDDGVIIKNLHDIWPILVNQKRDIDIRVAIDPNLSVNDDWSKFALFKELKNVRVNFEQDPILRKHINLFPDGAYNTKLSIAGNSSCLEYNRYKTIEVNAYTVHAKGLKIKVEMLWDDSWLPFTEKKGNSVVISPVEEKGEYGKTIIEYPLHAPENEYYEARFRIALIRQNEEVADTVYSPIRITR